MKNRLPTKKSFRLISNKRYKNRRLSRSVFIAEDFSDIEDHANAFQIIHDLAARAGNNAAAEAKAAGLSRIYIRNYKRLVKVSPSGDEIEIESILKKASFYIKCEPSTILHAIKR